jgi:hypothetical protein
MNIDFTADVPQPNSQTKQKVDLTADDLTADEPLPNPLIARIKKLTYPRTGIHIRKQNLTASVTKTKITSTSTLPKALSLAPFYPAKDGALKGTVVIFSIKSLVVTNTKYPVLFYEGMVFV